MEDKGVFFNLDDKFNAPESYTVTIKGDPDQYIRTIKSLLALVRNVKEDMMIQDEIIDVIDLIADLLPTYKQIVIQKPVNKI